MNATKILWGQVLLVSFVVLASLWGATEWVAWRLAFQSQLGRPWFEIFGWPLYQPPAFFWWWFAYDADWVAICRQLHRVTHATPAADQGCR